MSTERTALARSGRRDTSAATGWSGAREVADVRDGCAPRPHQAPRDLAAR